MVRAQITDVVATTIKKLYGVNLDPEVIYADSAHGDFTTNVAFKLAKALKKSPSVIAGEVAIALKQSDIERAEAAGAGFVNIFMSKDFWAQKVSEIASEYLNNNSGKGQKVQVEFISANPTGPLTLGNARGGFIGDVLSNVLSANGYDVVREYYFNDSGTQITKLLDSVKVAAGLIDVEDRQYSGEYIDKLAKEYRHELSTQTDDKLKQLITKAIFNTYIKPVIKNMGIGFDVWFNETDLILRGGLKETLEILKKKHLTEEKDGALWLKSGLVGDKREERVLIKSNGDATYLANDIAYHLNIFETRKFNRAIKELGPDHIAQFPSLKVTIESLIPSAKLEMVGHQQLRLIRDGKEFKMSKRLGQFVTVQDLLDEVGADVARFFMLMRSNDTHMDFDLDLAKEQSQKNPMHYVMYAYARSSSIIKQALAKDLKIDTKITQLTEVEVLLIKQLMQLPELVAEIATSYEVHKLTFYGVELAKIFHEHYEQERIIDMDPEVAGKKLYLIYQFKVCMEAYFKILGLKPKSHM